MPASPYAHHRSPATPTPHPLLKLRRLTIATDTIGIAFCLLAIFALNIVDISSSHVPPFLLAIILLLVSLVVVCIDLHKYAARQHQQTLSQLRIAPRQNPRSGNGRHEETNPCPAPRLRSSSPGEPTWPTKGLLITDFVLALLLQWLFWGTFAQIVNGGRAWNYYGGAAEMFESYANLANWFASVCHGVAFWKEIVARKRAAWEREREDVEAGWVCAGCGAARHHYEDEQMVVGEGHTEEEVVGGADDVGKRSGFGVMRFPRWAMGLGGKGGVDAKTQAVGGEGDEGGNGEPAATEPLLATPDDSGTEVGAASASEGGYGTLGRSTESVGSVPETVVRKKDKGKKRLVDVE